MTDTNVGLIYPAGNIPAREVGNAHPSTYGDAALVNLLMEVYARSCAYGTETLHKRWVELHTELLARLEKYASGGTQIMDEFLRKRLLDCIPDSWLDPLLSGSQRIIAQPPTNTDIERLCRALRDRIAVVCKEAE